MASIEEIIDISIAALSMKYPKKAIETAVNELCDPCNILIPMSTHGKWGFGHLRYQEHLAAEELVRNRGIEIEPYLASGWWRSVLVLFSQMTDNFENIFTSHFLSTGNIGPAFNTLKAMIFVRPKKEKTELMQLLVNHKLMDAQDADPFDEGEY